MEDKPYMVSQTIKYSDGTETLIRYKRSGEVELSDLAPLAEELSAEVKPEEVEVLTA